MPVFHNAHNSQPNAMFTLQFLVQNDIPQCHILLLRTDLASSICSTVHPSSTTCNGETNPSCALQKKTDCFHWSNLSTKLTTYYLLFTFITTMHFPLCLCFLSHCRLHALSLSDFRVTFPPSHAHFVGLSLVHCSQILFHINPKESHRKKWIRPDVREYERPSLSCP